MSLAIKLFGAAALCAFCCALPVTALFAAGLLRIIGLSWSIVGGLALLAVAAGLLMLTRRNFTSASAKSRGCSSVRRNGCASEIAAPPIACSLSSDDYQERTKSIRNLAKRSLLSAHRTPLTLQLVYARHAFDDVQSLVRAEQQCCAFLRFEVTENDHAVQLLITAPAEAADATDALFDHFAPELARQ